MIDTKSTSAGISACMTVNMRYVELRERQTSSSGLNFSCFDNDGVVLLPPVTEHVFLAQEQDCFRTLMSLFHPQYSISYVMQLCCKSAQVVKYLDPVCVEQIDLHT